MRQDRVAAGDPEALIGALAADLTPVRRPRPLLGALSWTALVIAVAVGLAAICDIGAVARRLEGAPDLVAAAAASALTAVLAAWAAFELSLPDRSRAWALLPLPAAAVWIAASGAGCLRQWIAPVTAPPTLTDSEDCLAFILALSIPLAAALIVMLRSGYSLQPRLTAAMGGLASAAAAATLLNFVHPYDAAALDLLVHAIAIGAVVIAVGWTGRRALA